MRKIQVEKYQLVFFSYICVLNREFMVGRLEQRNIMTDLLRLEKSYFVAVTGRRRVGKTYLIDQVYKDHFCYTVTGIQDGNQNTQISNFIQKLAEYSNIPIVTIPANWQQAFQLLKKYLEKLPKNKKQVIFIDELPWMSTVRSGFIQLLAHLWNDYLSKQKHFILVICGSATSWINKKILGDKGGFHNRVTHHISLEPFSILETKAFLEGKKIKLADSDFIEVYMALGGIPYYLDLIHRGESSAVAIGRLCFSKSGLLRNEYNNLYRAIFEESTDHEAIVKVLGKSRNGLVRSEIGEKSNVSLGGPYTRAMNDLILSGFVIEQSPFGKSKQGTIYKLMDEYSVFYHKFIANNKNFSTSSWQQITKSQSYKIWLGFAFETLCLRLMDQIKRVLGIADIQTSISSFRVSSSSDMEGFQIDIIIDRADNSINLCECKYYSEPVEINKSYSNQLNKRKELFIIKTKTRKNVFTTLITNKGAIRNDHYYQCIDKEIVLHELTQTK